MPRMRGRSSRRGQALLSHNKFWNEVPSPEGEEEAAAGVSEGGSEDEEKEEPGRREAVEPRRRFAAGIPRRRPRKR